MRVLTLWKILSRLPAGKWLFSKLVGHFVPYTGSIGARIEQLGPGTTTVTLRDRRCVRNHLGSIHACALANLGEMALGLAMIALQPKNGRFIPFRLDTEYLKKARGPLHCRVELPYREWPEEAEWVTEALLQNESGETVCRVVCHYKVGSKASS